MGAQRLATGRVCATIETGLTRSGLCSARLSSEVAATTASSESAAS
jgi:hypothetical protein